MKLRAAVLCRGTQMIGWQLYCLVVVQCITCMLWQTLLTVTLHHSLSARTTCNGKGHLVCAQQAQHLAGQARTAPCRIQLYSGVCSCH